MKREGGRESGVEAKEESEWGMRKGGGERDSEAGWGVLISVRALAQGSLRVRRGVHGWIEELPMGGGGKGGERSQRSTSE